MISFTQQARQINLIRGRCASQKLWEATGISRVHFRRWNYDLKNNTLTQTSVYSQGCGLIQETKLDI